MDLHTKIWVVDDDGGVRESMVGDEVEPEEIPTPHGVVPRYFVEGRFLMRWMPGGRLETLSCYDTADEAEHALDATLLYDFQNSDLNVCYSLNDALLESARVCEWIAEKKKD